MEILVWVVHVLAAAALIGLVLMQHGKGADMGAAFGTGSAGSLFGSAGSANFLSRSTAIAATVFFVTSMTLTYMYSHRTPSLGVMDKAAVSSPALPAGATQQPAAPGTAPTPSKSSEIPK